MAIQHYYKLNEGTKGAINISSIVFQEAALDAMTECVEGELKDSLCLKSGSKKASVVALIDVKNHVSVEVSVLGYNTADINSALSKLQQAIYDRIYSLTEISKVKVHVSVSGIVGKKDKE